MSTVSNKHYWIIVSGLTYEYTGPCLIDKIEVAAYLNDSKLDIYSGYLISEINLADKVQSIKKNAKQCNTLYRTLYTELDSINYNITFDSDKEILMPYSELLSKGTVNHVTKPTGIFRGRANLYTYFYDNIQNGIHHLSLFKDHTNVSNKNWDISEHDGLFFFPIVNENDYIKLEIKAYTSSNFISLNGNYKVDVPTTKNIISSTSDFILIYSLEIILNPLEILFSNSIKLNTEGVGAKPLYFDISKSSDPNEFFHIETNLFYIKDSNNEILLYDKNTYKYKATSYGYKISDIKLYIYPQWGVLNPNPPIETNREDKYFFMYSNGDSTNSIEKPYMITSPVQLYDNGNQVDGANLGFRNTGYYNMLPPLFIRRSKDETGVTNINETVLNYIIGLTNQANYFKYTSLPEILNADSNKVKSIGTILAEKGITLSNIITFNSSAENFLQDGNYKPYYIVGKGKYHNSILNPSQTIEDNLLYIFEPYTDLLPKKTSGIGLLTDVGVCSAYKSTETDEGSGHKTWSENCRSALSYGNPTLFWEEIHKDVYGGRYYVYNGTYTDYSMWDKFFDLDEFYRSGADYKVNIFTTKKEENNIVVSHSVFMTNLANEIEKNKRISIFSFPYNLSYLYHTPTYFNISNKNDGNYPKLVIFDSWNLELLNFDKYKALAIMGWTTAFVIGTMFIPYIFWTVFVPGTILGGTLTLGINQDLKDRLTVLQNVENFTLKYYQHIEGLTSLSDKNLEIDKSIEYTGKSEGVINISYNNDDAYFIYNKNDLNNVTFELNSTAAEGYIDASITPESDIKFISEIPDNSDYVTLPGSSYHYNTNGRLCIPTDDNLSNLKKNNLSEYLVYPQLTLSKQVTLESAIEYIGLYESAYVDSNVYTGENYLRLDDKEDDLLSSIFSSISVDDLKTASEVGMSTSFLNDKELMKWDSEVEYQSKQLSNRNITPNLYALNINIALSDMSVYLNFTKEFSIDVYYEGKLLQTLQFVNGLSRYNNIMLLYINPNLINDNNLYFKFKYTPNDGHSVIIKNIGLYQLNTADDTLGNKELNKIKKLYANKAFVYITDSDLIKRVIFPCVVTYKEQNGCYLKWYDSEYIPNTAYYKVIGYYNVSDSYSLFNTDHIDFFSELGLVETPSIISRVDIRELIS